MHVLTCRISREGPEPATDQSCVICLCLEVLPNDSKTFTPSPDQYFAITGYFRWLVSSVYCTAPSIKGCTYLFMCFSFSQDFFYLDPSLRQYAHVHPLICPSIHPLTPLIISVYFPSPQPHVYGSIYLFISLFICSSSCQSVNPFIPPSWWRDTPTCRLIPPSHCCCRCFCCRVDGVMEWSTSPISADNDNVILCLLGHKWLTGTTSLIVRCQVSM